ncbi:hypothetical protein H8959_021251, partial [Pygathrix nigripes]
INATQAMKKRRKRKVTTNKCLEQVSQLLGLWRRFIRTLLKKQILQTPVGRATLAVEPRPK